MSLKELRQRQHLTLKEFAKRLGVSHVCVIHWEQGKSIPNAKYLPRIAETLAIPVKEVLKVLKIR